MYAKIVLAVFVSFMVGLAASDVGEMPKCDKPYGLDLPILIVAILLLPAALGYLAGREDGGHRE